MNFHICPLALHHGFKFLKPGLIHYGIQVDTSNIKLEDFLNKKGGSQTFQIKVLKTNTWIGHLRTYKPHLEGHRVIVLDKIAGIRDQLLVKSKRPTSQYKQLKSIFEFSAAGELMDVRPKVPAVAVVDPFSSVTTLRNLSTGQALAQLTPAHQNKVASQIEDGIVEFLVSAKNFSPTDANYALTGNDFTLVQLLFIVFCPYSASHKSC